MTTATDISWDDLKAMILSLAEQGKETDRRIRARKRQWGRLGQFVQDRVEPAVVRLFQEQSIPVHRVRPNVRA
ncbi:hypothetical protein GWK36_14240 [Caldichromatium japonicum]|uniref:Uncharacterized protein n=1 Tax=Caldichromatium japonicum TaxID=2699430 RepID=A0A6G7VGI6_9GAMM|nr:hypothetical protein [Caldichromatium japonicum]QIK38958.1 hypothetical protein GWK36_14240 [Caldichromatium japonicum]